MVGLTVAVSCLQEQGDTANVSQGPSSRYKFMTIRRLFND